MVLLTVVKQSKEPGMMKGICWEVNGLRCHVVKQEVHWAMPTGQREAAQNGTYVERGMTAYQLGVSQTGRGL